MAISNITNISSVLYLQNNLNPNVGVVSALLGDKSTQSFSGLDLLSSTNTSLSQLKSQNNVDSLSQFIQEYIPNSAGLLKDVSAVNSLARLVSEGFSNSSQYANPYEVANIISSYSLGSDNKSVLSLLL